MDKIAKTTLLYPANKQWLIAGIGIVLTVISYWVIDKPLVFWVAHHVPPYLFFKLLTDIPAALAAAIFISYLLLAARVYAGRWTRHDQALLLIANSFAITTFLIIVLKIIFARYWPATWVDNNLSLLANNVYGFKWFTESAAYAAFPSGHGARTVTAMTALAIAYPRCRRPAVVLSGLVMVGLLALNYHFLSDVIAGAVIGYLVANNTAIIMRIKPVE